MKFLEFANLAAEETRRERWREESLELILDQLWRRPREPRERRFLNATTSKKRDKRERRARWRSKPRFLSTSANVEQDITDAQKQMLAC